jgi:hypothetical protein
VLHGPPLRQACPGVLLTVGPCWKAGSRFFGRGEGQCVEGSEWREW